MNLKLTTLSLAAVVALSASASAQYYRSVASAGTVDEDSQSLVQFDNAIATASTVGTVTLRYNIPMQLIPWSSSGQKCLEVRYLDAGLGAKVTVTVKQRNVYTGTVQTLAVFNSDSFAGSSDYQTRGVWFSGLSFADGNTCWIEAQITRSTYRYVNPFTGANTTLIGSAGLEIVGLGLPQLN